jgi:hypothetical protein
MPSWQESFIVDTDQPPQAAAAPDQQKGDSRRIVHWIQGSAMALVVFALGFWMRGASDNSNRDAAWPAWLPSSQLHATGTAIGDTFAMATGPIDDEVDGVYILDFLTGDLQCVVLNYRSGRFNAAFKTNVMQDLGLVNDAAKRPKYLLTTGLVNFPRGATAARPGNSIVYVLDATTGNFAAYGIPWRRELAATGRAQVAGLQLLDVGRARTAALRE